MIDVIIDDKALNAGLKKLLRRGEDMEPVMGRISAMMLSSVQENFLQEGRPQKWTPLSEVTKKLRAQKGHWPGPMLRISQGGLFSTLQAFHNANEAGVGSDKIYSALQNFGGMAGRGRKVSIPAREFMNIPEGDMAEIVNIVPKHLTS